jgi:hypothetical protein
MNRRTNKNIINQGKKKLVLWKNKINKSLRKLTKRRINKIIHENGKFTANTNEIQMIIQEYFKTLYSCKLENAEEIDTFIYICDLQKLN